MRKSFFLSILFIGLLSGSCIAESYPAENDDLIQEFSLEAFRQMAVLEHGRVKPVDTYARNLLLRFSGKRSLNRQPAVSWLARLLFDPGSTKEEKIFLVNNPEIPMAMGLKPVKKRRYSFSQLESGYSKLLELAQVSATIEEKQRTIVEQEILRVYQNLNLYVNLSYVFRFALSHPDFTILSSSLRDQLQLPPNEEEFSFLDIALKAANIEQITRGLEKKDPSSWNASEAETMRLLSRLYHWSLQYKNLPFHLVPSFQTDDEQWLSPWDAIAKNLSLSDGRKEIRFLGDMVKAFRSQDQAAFDGAVQSFNQIILERVNLELQAQIGRVPLEVSYNQWQLFLWAKVCYGFAFFLFLISLLSRRTIWHRLSFGLIGLGCFAHTIALVMRIIILARPPVSNLYETFIFVGFVAVLLGLIIERVNRQWLGIVVASVCGFVFLLIANKYSAEGDTLKMLVAVLNSNFWLGTHVLTITTGYAGCCVAGVVGHVYILQVLTQPQNKKLLSRTYQNLMGTLGFGLIMTFLGTTLGGIWADQSWGRFWGWDPKENGALLIILWTAMIFHARIGKMIGPLGVAASSALGIIVVMWAWFGVNLLSIGLHSYGFTSGIATVLTIYALCQLLFIGVTVPLAKNRLRIRSS